MAIFTEDFNGGGGSFGIFSEDTPPGPGTGGANDLTISTLSDTPSVGTGPECPASGSPDTNEEFVFLEGSSTLSGETHCMTATIPIPAANPPALDGPFFLSFWYYAFGDNIGVVTVNINGGTPEWTYPGGQEQTGQFDNWTQVGLDVTALAGTSPTVQVCMSEGNGSISTFESDFSIDHFQIFACAQVCELTSSAAQTLNTDPGVCGAFANVTATTTAVCNNPVTNDFNAGGADASGVYPVGTTTVTFETTDAFGNPLTSTSTVTVNDNQAPVFSGCDDVTIHLDPGQCCQVYDFLVTATDNCEGAGMPATISTTFADGNGASGNMFDVTNLSAFPVEILSYEGNL